MLNIIIFHYVDNLGGPYPHLAGLEKLEQRNRIEKNANFKESLLHIRAVTPLSTHSAIKKIIICLHQSSPSVRQFEHREQKIYIIF